MDLGPTTAAYTADRAASLAGVPKSTVYYWAHTGLVVPSVSRERVKKWSYADLLLLRLVDWLRQDKPEVELPRTSMQRIRKEVWKAERLGERLLSDGMEVYVESPGRLVFGHNSGFFIELGQGASQSLFGETLNLVRAFEGTNGLRGPDLAAPRPTLRIVPGKLSGEPHVWGTRIVTIGLAVLRSRGFTSERVRELYPVLTDDNVAEAFELEEQLEANLHARVA
jgi:uncharacterized protein (DUF433 family)